MDISTEIRRLLLLGAVGDLVGARIYPVRTPQNPAYPYIVIDKIDGAPEQDLAGANSLKHAPCQIDCYSNDDYTAAKALAKAVIDALSDFSGNVTGGRIESCTVTNDGKDMSEPELEEFRVLLEFSIWYREG